jgi:predicted enzyme related to lactoylglutathione lyase
MQRVLGIGGIFLKAKDPKALVDWYRNHLGMDIQAWGGLTFAPPATDHPHATVPSVWSVMPSDTDYFAPSHSTFMVNYRVENLDELLKVLRNEGCAVQEKTDSSEYGKFGWVMDPEGNKIELWEPPVGAGPLPD